MGKLCRTAAMAVAVALLLVTSIVTGCGGGGEEETNTVVLGWLADQTGPSGQTFKELRWGMEDFLEDMQANKPIPGVSLGTIVYDTRLEYARAPTGYEYLAEQGTTLLLHYNAPMAAAVAPRQAEDEIPSLGFGSDPATNEIDWQYYCTVDWPTEGRFILDYLIRDWWETKGMTRPVKVGAVVPTDYASGTQYWQGFVAADEANPGKCDLKKVTGTMSQTAWASEVAAIQDRDVVIVTLLGSGAATFLKEASARGYQGAVISTTISILGSWTLVTNTIPKSSLNGLLLPQSWFIWTDQYPFVEYMASALDRYRPSSAATLKQGTTWATGWTLAYIISEIVRGAADRVGPQNVDRAAILDAIEELDLQIEGMPPIGLGNSGGYHIIQPYLKVIRYDAAADEWRTVSEWVNALGH